MAEPPPYDETEFENNEEAIVWKSDLKTTPQRISIRDEVGTSRSQHVAALVAKLLPHIRERAKSGLSRTSLLLLPSDQAGASRKGQLVGFPEDDRPILIQLEGRYDGTQFWTQKEALKSLEEQMLTEILGEIPQPVLEEAPLPPRPIEQPKPSFWGRKPSKAPEPPKPVIKPVKLPVTVEVELDQVNFRTETDFGLYETIRGRAILVAVDIK